MPRRKPPSRILTIGDLVSTSEQEKLQTSMASIAESMVSSTRDIMKLDYDFSPKSLQLLDQALAVYHPEGFTFEQGWHGYAAYTGEVVRRALGGQWNMESDGSGASLRGVGGKATIYPFLWVNKRIEAIKAGTGDSKVAAKYLKLLAALGRDAEAPEVIAENFVESHAQAEGAPYAENFANQDEDDDDDEDEGEMNFGVEILHAAPTICFFIISAADGKIDKKEIKTFFTEVMKFATSPNTLVRDVFSSTPSRFEEFADEFMQNPGNALLKLVHIRQLAEAHHSKHADGFCTALNEMSKNIASASGGFFGFGSKISKDEQSALDVIRNMLSHSSK